MGVYIKGMEKPKSSRYCPFTRINDWDHKRCVLGHKYEWHKDRLCDDCPLIEIQPHGDLIDRSELMIHEVLLPRDGGSMRIVYSSYIRNAPTIIESEECE